MMRFGMLNAKYYLLNAVWNFGVGAGGADIMIFVAIVPVERVECSNGGGGTLFLYVISWEG